jgi:hypothetical protein
MVLSSVAFLPYLPTNNPPRMLLLIGIKNNMFEPYCFVVVTCYPTYLHDPFFLGCRMGRQNETKPQLNWGSFTTQSCGPSSGLGGSRCQFTCRVNP